MDYHKEYTPDYLKQKKVKNNGEREFTQAQGRHEPIVTVEEFERVQRIMEQKRTGCKNLNTGRRTKGKKPHTTVWGKLLICECGHIFNMRKWDRSDRQVQNSYQCYSSVPKSVFLRIVQIWEKSLIAGKSVYFPFPISSLERSSLLLEKQIPFTRPLIRMTSRMHSLDQWSRPWSRSSRYLPFRILQNESQASRESMGFQTNISPIFHKNPVQPDYHLPRTSIFHCYQV